MGIKGRALKSLRQKGSKVSIEASEAVKDNPAEFKLQVHELLRQLFIRHNVELTEETKQHLEEKTSGVSGADKHDIGHGRFDKLGLDSEEDKKALEWLNVFLSGKTNLTPKDIENAFTEKDGKLHFSLKLIKD